MNLRSPIFRVCICCGEVWPSTPEFFASRSDCIGRTCRECERKRHRTYHASHASKIRARKMRRYQENHQSELQRQRAYRREHPDQVRETRRRYVENHRDQIAESDRRRRATNVESRRRKAAEWRAENLARARENGRRWHREHPDNKRAANNSRRARRCKASGSHSAEDIRSQVSRQRGHCFYCRRRIDGGYHVDHIVPLALGGSDGPENLVIACPLCNLSKRAKHPMDFAGILF